MRVWRQARDSTYFNEGGGGNVALIWAGLTSASEGDVTGGAARARVRK